MCPKDRYNAERERGKMAERINSMEIIEIISVERRRHDTTRV